MTTNVLGKNLEARELEDFKSYLNKKLYRLEDLIQDLPEDSVHLKATCEKFPTKAAYKVSLEMKIKGNQHYVYEDDHTITEAVDLAIDKIVNSLKHSLDRKTSRKKARASRRALKRADLETEAPEPGGVDESWPNIFSELKKLLPKISIQVEQELRRLELSGELARGQLSTEAVIDTLIIDLYDKSASMSDELSFEQWVAQRTLFVIRRLARQESAVNDLISLNRNSELKPAALNVNDLDSDMLNFYQPDETLNIESTVAAETTP